jgi:hypothetical protein
VKATLTSSHDCVFYLLKQSLLGSLIILSTLIIKVVTWWPGQWHRLRMSIRGVGP